MTLWLMVTNDEYELPLAVASSSADLAKQIGKSRDAVLSSYSKYMKGKRKTCPYRKVEVEDDEL